MARSDSAPRLYSDLAWLWPLWGEVDGDYADYCRAVDGLIRRYAQRPVQSLLVIGCGGGKNVCNLKRAYTVTGLDLSPEMLAQARELNPECRFVQGDMRHFDLGQVFDAILIDDAISHMHSRTDLEAALQAAVRHLAPGGVLVTTPDATRESFRQNQTTATTVVRDGLTVTFIENLHDPNPDDEHYETTVIYLIREYGQLRIETDHWTLGLFPIAVWHQALRASGLELQSQAFALNGDHYTMLAGCKPG